MNHLLTISLKQIRFRAFHGLYPEEQKTGNDFLLNLSVSYKPGSGIITGITDTIDYGKLYSFLKDEMREPRKLLETFVMETLEKLHLEFPQIQKAELSITKLQVPVVGMDGSVIVTYSRDF